VLRKEKLKKQEAAIVTGRTTLKVAPVDDEDDEEKVENDKRDLDWAAVLKRTFEAYIRGEIPSMYGEWIRWD